MEITLTKVPVAAGATLQELQTPCLVLDADRMERNIARLRRRLSQLGVGIRPHLKTAKSIEVARAVMDTPSGPAAVSTLEEAAQFAKAGVGDMIYAVGIAPAKLNRVLALREEGVESGLDLSGGSNGSLPSLAVGDRVRILPNHACATAAQHDRYHVVRGTSPKVEADWARFGGW